MPARLQDRIPFVPVMCPHLTDTQLWHKMQASFYKPSMWGTGGGATKSFSPLHSYSFKLIHDSLCFLRFSGSWWEEQEYQVSDFLGSERDPNWFAQQCCLLGLSDAQRQPSAPEKTGSMRGSC